MIRAVIFDCFGVILGDAYGALMQQLSTDEQRKKWQEYGDLADLGDMSHDERAQRAAELLQMDISEIRQAELRLRRNEPLMSLARELRKTYKIGMLSNVMRDYLKQYFSDEELKQYFDDVVLSYEVHLIKPQPEVYELAAQRLGVQPSECVFVDDNANNVAGAVAVGMKGILYKDFYQLQQELGAVLERKDA